MHKPRWVAEDVLAKGSGQLVHSLRAVAVELGQRFDSLAAGAGLQIGYGAELSSVSLHGC